MVKIFIDFEMNPIPRDFVAERELCRNEVIQIGAVALDGKDSLIGEFEQMVKPQFSNTVTPSIFRLTGITSDMLETGVSFDAGINALIEWCETVSKTEDYEIYAWSDSDLIQLQQEMMIKELTHYYDHHFMNVWIDFQFIFSELVGISSAMSLDKAVQALDLNFAGSKHSALSDAKNTGRIYQMVQDKEAFDKAMKPIKEMMAPSGPIGTQLGSVFNLGMFDFQD